MGIINRLDGIYPQRQEGFFMLRVKLPAGVISSAQARAVSNAARLYGRSEMHLTSRGSIEIHWITESHLSDVKQLLSSVGLTSRGACGTAVRGVSCSTSFTEAGELLERLSQRIQRHFTGNPRFERLPKKFKIAVEGESSSGRHLIQDAGVLLSNNDHSAPLFDVYAGGGLGKEPRSAFLLESAIPEERVIPIIESVARVYAANAKPGKRLKHLVSDIGEARFRELLCQDAGYKETLPEISEIMPNRITPTSAGKVTADIFAGEITSSQLDGLAEFADKFSSSYLVSSTDQNIDFYLAEGNTYDDAYNYLKNLGFRKSDSVLRVCPGSHTCKMGLSATREIASEIAERCGSHLTGLAAAVSGCPNSCTQPQLADIGIITSSLPKNESGEREPLFDIYRRRGERFGEKISESVPLSALLNEIMKIRGEGIAE